MDPQSHRHGKAAPRAAAAGVDAMDDNLGVVGAEVEGEGVGDDEGGLVDDGDALFAAGGGVGLDDAAARLGVAHGAASSELAARINGRTFTCADNPMGIGWFRLDFTGDKGCFVYSNAQGEKALHFGLQKNVFGKFPQLGYSDDRGNVHELTDFRYDCAASAGWLDGRTLQLRVQIIDRYFGSMTAAFGFRDENTVAVRMVKAAEDFLGEYQGWMAAETKP